MKGLLSLNNIQPEEPPKSRRRPTELDGSCNEQFQLNLLKEQLELKNIEISKLKTYVRKVYCLLKQAKSRLASSRNDNQKLFIRMQTEKLIHKEEISEMYTEGSLFEEFNKIGQINVTENLSMCEQTSVQIDKSRRCWFFI